MEYNEKYGNENDQKNKKVKWKQWSRERKWELLLFTQHETLKILGALLSDCDHVFAYFPQKHWLRQPSVSLETQ